MYESQYQIMKDTWQAFERNLCRLLTYEGFENVRLVGQTGDHGADVTASKAGKKWLFQAKHWKKPVGIAVVQETIDAIYEYKADIPVIVSSNGFESAVKEHQVILLSRKIPLQLWDSTTLVNRTKRLPDKYSNTKEPRRYQEPAIDEIVGSYYGSNDNRALVVMATGLGKTFVAAESIRRIRATKKCQVLVCAHTNDLVYQLEKAFWPFLKPTESTLIWNSYEHPTYEMLEKADMTFACVDSVSSWLQSGRELPDYGILLVDECHHVGSSMYDRVFEALSAGKPGGSFALGLTATPWRSDEVDLATYFGEPRVSIDMVMGLNNGFLANVDYRMYTDNIDWNSLQDVQGRRFSPKQINRTLFINQWDDSVVYTLKDAWYEQKNPRAIVFCGTIEHALIMRDKINTLGFCKAEAMYSGSAGNEYEPMSQYRRNRILSDFSDGSINVVCAVDIFNEGIDVPDVNILVFQRVTHSRRIFIQQLGRGLRISEGKEKVIVLDFVSDIRRFAAGISLKDSLAPREPGGVRIDLPNKVTFMKVGGEDPQTETFLRQWLDDVVAIEGADEDASVLHFPPLLPGGKV
ncbi:DEAD/DEAH box helicase family protein [Mediterraneibacter gnavus]|uniref:DEAD/DEAH box helicase family protein n=1 Tax=Mediterraneibacter gnavus TaxID=33038 RepID=UPI00232F839E|nr:DEAD/DEAH box helicase family protein [Mediterraneibacter gnavus]MDB8711975.1 DEAD/DEAH box helicase family protein [Mediterraneibacter gnavus]MDB8715004.1 DEAD/DEAH box helicase family protein [Mediterraneibacter gnavus]